MEIYNRQMELAIAVKIRYTFGRKDNFLFETDRTDGRSAAAFYDRRRNYA